jgi:hypothetical protein
LDHHAENNEVGVRVVKARPRLAHERTRQRDLQQLTRPPLAEDVGIEGIDEVEVLLDPVGVAGGRVGGNDTSPAGEGARGVIIGDRVLFEASANPFGENPGQVCQLFSISTRATTSVRSLTFRGMGSRTG